MQWEGTLGKETMCPLFLKNLKDIMYCTDVIHMIKLK